MLFGSSAEPVADLKEDQSRCPRDFFFVARYNFGAHPAPTERDKGIARGQAIKRDIRAYLQWIPRSCTSARSRSSRRPPPDSKS
jgi:hypothetical protein